MALYYLWRKTKISGKIIDHQNKELKTSLQDKEILMQEIHHRVKNNLQIITAFLQIQSSKSSSQETIRWVEELEGNIHSMVMVHKLLYENNSGDTVFMDQYFKSLLEHLRNSFMLYEFKVITEIEDITLNISRVVPIGLIVSELYANTCKHAFVEVNELNAVRISFNKYEGGRCKLVYTDNGIGTEGASLNSQDESKGFELVKLLVEEMDGDIIVKNKNGLTITIEFYDKN